MTRTLPVDAALFRGYPGVEGGHMPVTPWLLSAPSPGFIVRIFVCTRQVCLGAPPPPFYSPPPFDPDDVTLNPIAICLYPTLSAPRLVLTPSWPPLRTQYFWCMCWHGQGLNLVAGWRRV